MSIQTVAGDSVETTNYSVVRVRQDVGRQSSVGGIVTSKILNGRNNIVYGADYTYSTSKMFHDKNLIVSGAFAQSQTSDSVNNHNSSYSFSISYPNDVIEYDFGFYAPSISPIHTTVSEIDLENPFPAQLNIINSVNAITMVNNINYHYYFAFIS